MIARGFGLSMAIDAAADDDDVKRNGDAIAVLMAVRRLIKELDDDRDRLNTVLLLEKIHTTTRK